MMMPKRLTLAAALSASRAASCAAPAASHRLGFAERAADAERHHDAGTAHACERLEPERECFVAKVGPRPPMEQRRVEQEGASGRRRLPHRTGLRSSGPRYGLPRPDIGQVRRPQSFAERDGDQPVVDPAVHHREPDMAVERRCELVRGRSRAPQIGIDLHRPRRVVGQSCCPQQRLMATPGAWIFTESAGEAWEPSATALA